MRLAIRGWKNGVLVFEEFTEADEPDDLLPLAEKHARNLMDGPHMLEIEFLDDPDLRGRFFRMGTDPAGMVNPIAVGIIGRKP